MKVLHDELESYLADESGIRSRGVNCVYMPENKREMAQTVKGLNGPFTVFGGGTGLCGGSVQEGGVVAAVKYLNKIEISKNKKSVFAGAGATLGELHTFLNKNDLWYPVDSTEQTATIGGNLATNAWGTRSFKYGSVRNFVKGIEIILPGGEALSIKRGDVIADGESFRFTAENKRYTFNIKDLSGKAKGKTSAGYYMKKNMDLIDLFIGSEGTLGVITSAELDVAERPHDIMCFLVSFQSEEKAFDFIKKIKKESKKYDILSLEYYDCRSIQFLEKDYPLVKGKGALVFLEKEVSRPKDDEEILETLGGFIEDAAGPVSEVHVASTKNKEGFIYEMREALPRMVNEYMRGRGMKKVSTDFSFPESKFDKMIKIYKNNLKGIKIKYVIFGHAGNNNIHINFLPSCKKEYDESKLLYKQIAWDVVGAGGCVSAEHGIGKLKREYFYMMYSRGEIEAMKKVKKTLDYKGICGNGNIFYD